MRGLTHLYFIIQPPSLHHHFTHPTIPCAFVVVFACCNSLQLQAKRKKGSLFVITDTHILRYSEENKTQKERRFAEAAFPSESHHLQAS
ncbi:hypothetical protein ACSBR1_014031 [Camellia fascicularis]